MSLTLLALALAGTAAAASPAVVNGKAQGVIDRGRNLLTLPALSKYRPVDYKTIESAHDTTITKPDALTGLDKFLSKLKLGHFIGTALLPLLGLPKLLDYFGVDSDSIWMKLSKIAIPFEVVGTAVSWAVATLAKNDFVESMKSLVDNFCQRLEVTRDKKIRDVITKKEIDKYMTFDNLIMEEGKKMEFGAFAETLMHRGDGRNVIEATGVGKTSSVYASGARVFENDSYIGDTVEIWKANSNIMEGTLSDVGGLGFITKTIDRFTGMLGLGKLTGETIAERLERLIANAVRYHLETGKIVIILLDEAHEMLGKKSSSVSFANGSEMLRSNGQEGSGNPLNRSKTAEELGPLFEDKLNSILCKGVGVIATSNSAAEDIAYHLLRRLGTDPVVLTKPREKERKEKLETTIRVNFQNLDKYQAVKKDNLDVASVIKLAFNEANALQKFGEVDLFKSYFGNSEKAAQDAGFGAYIEGLKNRNILHYDHLGKAVHVAMTNYKGGGEDALVELLRIKLDSMVRSELGNRENCLTEVRKYSEFTEAQIKSVDKTTEKITTPEDQLVARVVGTLIDKLKEFLIPKAAA